MSARDRQPAGAVPLRADEDRGNAARRETDDGRSWRGPTVVREVTGFLLGLPLLCPHAIKLCLVQHDLDGVVPAQIAVFIEDAAKSALAGFPESRLRCAQSQTPPISTASRTLIGITSMPSGGAMAWMTANWPMPDGLVGSRKTAARVTPGAICWSSSSHLPLKVYSNCMKPVMLPPGRARLSTKPPPMGSTAIANTIGTMRVVCCAPRVDRRGGRNDDIRRKRDQFRRLSAKSFNIGAADPPNINSHVTAVGPAGPLQRLRETPRHRWRSYSSGPRCAARVRAAAPEPPRRPCCRRAAEQADELAPPHAGHGLPPGAAAYHSSRNRRAQADCRVMSLPVQGRRSLGQT